MAGKEAKFKAQTALGEVLVGSLSDRGSIPLASTIILGQKRCHAVKAAWHQHFKGGNDPCFLLFKIKDEIGFFR